MKKEILPTIRTWIMFGAPLILGSISIAVQLFAKGEFTPREQNLLTAMQFVSSLWFGWIVSSVFSENEFKQKQKQFALSAFRRIREIETTVERLLRRLEERRSPRDLSSEIKVIREIALSVQTTTRSSKADWGEIIGSEIKTLEEIEQVEKSAPSPANDEAIEKLYKKLPSSLEIEAREYQKSEERVNLIERDLIESADQKGYLELQAFWSNEFIKDIFELPLNSSVHVSIDDVGGRVGALIVRTESGESVGVIVNNTGSSYHDFTEALTRAIGKSRFSAEYFKKGEIDSNHLHDGENVRHYFAIRVKVDRTA